MPLQWTRGTGKNSKFRRSKAAEVRAAGVLGGRRVPLSGAIRRVPGQAETVGADVQANVYTANAVGAEAMRLHAEHKRTALAKMRVQRDWFKKIHVSSRNTAAPPAVILLFEQVDGFTREWVGLTSMGMACEGPRFEVVKELFMAGASMAVAAEDVDSWGRSGKEGVVPAITLTFSDADFPRKWVFVPIEMFRAPKE